MPSGASPASPGCGATQIVLTQRIVQLCEKHGTRRWYSLRPVAFAASRAVVQRLQLSTRCTAELK